jgi:hypothetical protein
MSDAIGFWRKDGPSFMISLSEKRLRRNGLTASRESGPPIFKRIMPITKLRILDYHEKFNLRLLKKCHCEQSEAISLYKNQCVIDCFVAFAPRNDSNVRGFSGVST